MGYRSRPILKPTRAQSGQSVRASCGKKYHCVADSLFKRTGPGKLNGLLFTEVKGVVDDAGYKSQVSFCDIATSNEDLTDVLRVPCYLKTQEDNLLETGNT